MGEDGIRHHNGKRWPGVYARYHQYNEAGVGVKSASKNFRTVALARYWVREHNDKIDLGQAEQIVPLRLSQASGEFPIGVSGLMDGTVQDYQFAVVKLIGCVGDLNVSDIGATHVGAGLRQQTPEPDYPRRWR